MSLGAIPVLAGRGSDGSVFLRQAEVPHNVGAGGVELHCAVVECRAAFT